MSAELSKPRGPKYLHIRGEGGHGGILQMTRKSKVALLCLLKQAVLCLQRQAGAQHGCQLHT